MRARDLHLAYALGQGIADAIRDALANLFGEAVTVVYSTNKQADGGVVTARTGSGGYRTCRRVPACPDSAYAVVDPEAWVLWEAGAVRAPPSRRAASSTSASAYLQLGSKEIPQPFQRAQTEPGDRKEGAMRFFEQVVAEFAAQSRPPADGGGKTPGQNGRHLYRPREEELRDAPTLPSEEAIQEWCSRLDGLKQENRFSETRQMHAWLKVAFGRDIAGCLAHRPADTPPAGRTLPFGGRSRQCGGRIPSGANAGPRDMFILRSLASVARFERQRRRRRVIERMKELHRARSRRTSSVLHCSPSVAAKG
jgi:hypothetical protein